MFIGGVEVAPQVATRTGFSLFMFTAALEAEHDSGRKARIMLRGVEKRGADEVALEAPGEQMEDPVI